jgi:hypothetical protein
MALVPCPECKREVSSAASACPHCGFPAAPRPACYACAAPATTRCVTCGELSCATHLNTIFVRDGESGANELRCRECFADAELLNRWGLVASVVVLVLFVVIVALFW